MDTSNLYNQIQPEPTAEPFKIIGLHILLLLVAFSILHFLGFITDMPNSGNLVHWDAAWYRDIANLGYYFDPTRQSNVAFFPLFPWFWKLLGSATILVCLVNGALFFTAAGFLAKAFRFTPQQIVMLLSLPSIFFMYVPYSEALFFAFGALILVGLFRHKPWMVVLGLFLCGLTRSSSLFFLPAIIMMEFLGNTAGTKSKIRNMVLYIATQFSAIALVTFVQWRATGQWFAFTKAQEQWNHALQLPKLPITTWGGHTLLWLDASAFWFGGAAGFFIVFLIWCAVSNKNYKPYFGKASIFSACYLVIISVYTLVSNGDNLYSLNRYVFATPFIFVLLVELVRMFPYNKTALSLLAGITLLLTLLFNSHSKLDGMSHLQTVWYFMLITGYLVAVFASEKSRYKYQIATGLYCLNLVLQFYLLNRYLHGEWVG